ncbi:MAG: hypothetical protein ACK5TN_09500 [Acidobacteriota bacterium]
MNLLAKKERFDEFSESHENDRVGAVGQLDFRRTVDATAARRRFRGDCVALCADVCASELKATGTGCDLFDLTKLLPRVRAARTDREYFKVVTEYVASFQDGQSRFESRSAFVAAAQIAVDIYDDKVLLEAWDRAEYPLGSMTGAWGMNW